MSDTLQVPDLGSFEFTFTDKELEDVLGFIERRQSGLAIDGIDDDNLDSVPMPNHPIITQSLSFPISLQFQPHNSHQVVVDGERALLPTPAPSPSPSSPFGQRQTRQLQPPSPPNAKIHPKSKSNNTVSSNAAEGKPNVSHSSVEKQRRDRINALIDELRELVPPPAQHHHQQQQHSITDVRRPKHVVLADTIALVRDLQHQVSALQLSNNNAQLQLQQKQEQQQQHQQSISDAAAAAAAAAVTAASATPPVASFRGKEASTESGPESVEIVPGDGCLYVKVHCRDRNGLLIDIVRTLKAVPLEISTAALTTTEKGYVYDVFQVVGASDVSVEDVKDRVMAAVFSISPGHVMGDSATMEKKRRAR